MKNGIIKIGVVNLVLLGLVFGLGAGMNASAEVNNSEWISIGPEGGRIKTLAINPLTPSTLYAGTIEQGIFKSTNSGDNWQPINTGLPDTYIYTFAIDSLTPSTLYAGTKGILKSTDSGDNWQTINTGMPNSSVVLTLAIDPLTPSTLYAGTRDQGIFKSTNSGDSWQAINTGLSDSYIFTSAINPLTPSTIYVSTLHSGIFKTTNSGDSWQAINEGLTISGYNRFILAIDPLTPSTLYVGTRKQGIFKSTNSGGSWQVINTGFPINRVNTLAIDPFTPSTIYVSTSKGIYKSTDSGDSWQAVSTVSGVLAINPLSPSILYIGSNNGQGILKSTNSGDSWQAVNIGLTNTHIKIFAIDPINPSTLYIDTAFNGILKSTDSGDSWRAITGLTYPHIETIVFDPLIPSTLYVGNHTDILKSTDSGESWQAINTGLPDTYIFTLAIDPLTPSTLYAGTRGLFKSTDSGESWQVVNTSFADRNTYITTLAIDLFNPSTLYIGTGRGGTYNIYKSTNSGDSWQPINTGLPDASIFTLAIDPLTPSTLYAGTKGIFKSTDSGDSWQAINTGFSINGVNTLAIDSLTPSTLYVGTRKQGIFKSTDSGDSWQAINTSFTNSYNTYITTLAIDPLTPSTLYVGTHGGGVFKYNGNSENTPPDYFSEEWAEKAINWAIEQEGKNSWDKLCMAFISDAFKIFKNRAASPNELKKNLSLNISENSPRGSIVFFSTNFPYENEGHIGISLGNGKIIHASSVVKTQSIEEIVGGSLINEYLGWAYPPEQWFESEFSSKFQEGDFVLKKEGWNVRETASHYSNKVTDPLESSNGAIISGTGDTSDANGIGNGGNYWWHIRIGEIEGWCAEEGLEKSESQSPTLSFSQEEGYINDGANPNEEIIGGEFDFKIVYNDGNNNPPEHINLIIDKEETFSWHQYGYKKKISVDTDLSNCNNSSTSLSAHSDYGIGRFAFGCKGGINSGEEITLTLEDKDVRVVNINLLLKQYDSDKLTGKIPTATVKIEGMTKDYGNIFSIKTVDMAGDKVDSDGVYFATANIKITEKDYRLGKIRISVPASTGEVWIGNIKIINRGDSAYNINPMHINNFTNENYLYDGIYSNDEQYQEVISSLPYGSYNYYFEFKNQQSDVKRFPENYDQSFKVCLDNFNPIPNGYQFKNGHIENISDDSKRILADEVFGTKLSSIIPLLSDAEIRALIHNLFRLDRIFGSKGLCYGMSLTSIGEHNGYLNFLNNYNDVSNICELNNHLFTKSNDNYENIFDASGDLNNKPLLKHLIKHHFMQLMDIKIKGVENVIDKLKLSSYINDYLLNIRYDKGGHTIVPLYVETLKNDASYKIYVYDSNIPKEINYLYINKDNNKWKWSYPPLDSLGKQDAISLTEIESVLPKKNFFDNWDTLLYIQEDFFIKILEKENEENFTGYVDNLYYDNLSGAELFFPSGAFDTLDEQNISRSTIVRSDDISKYEIKIWNTNSDMKESGIGLLGKNYYFELTGKVSNTPYTLALSGDASKITLKNLSDSNNLTLKKVIGNEGYQVSINRIPALPNGEYIFSFDWQALFQNEKGVTIQIDQDGDGVVEETITSDANLEFPAADIGGPYESTEGTEIIFDASQSTDTDGNIVLYEWDFDGDGVYDESSASPIIKHTWNDDYQGEITLRITDDEGLTDTDIAEVTINNAPPIVEAGENITVQYSDPVQFQGSFADPGILDAHSIVWNFGDGTIIENNLEPIHYYSTPGIYITTLTISDDDGGIGEDSLIVTVEKENIEIIVSDKQGFTFDKIILQAEIKDDDGEVLLQHSPYEVEFKVGDKVIGTSEINKDGKAEINWNVDLISKELVETYPIVVTFAGNEYYNEVQAQGTFILKSAKHLKQSTIEKLESAKIGDKKIDKEINRAIKHINKSLEDELWIDAFHLDTKRGKKVFREEEKAVDDLLDAIKRFKKEKEIIVLESENAVFPGFEETVNEVIQDLIKSDELLSEIALSEAKNISVEDPKIREKFDKQIEKAEEEMEKAEKELEKGRIDKVIKRLGKAWQYIQKAIKKIK